MMHSTVTMTSPEQVSKESFADSELAAFALFASLTGTVAVSCRIEETLPDNGGFSITSRYAPISLGDKLITLSQILVRPSKSLFTVEGADSYGVTPQLDVFDGHRTLVYRRPTVRQTHPHPGRSFTSLDQVAAPFSNELVSPPQYVSAGTIEHQHAYIEWLRAAEAQAR